MAATAHFHGSPCRVKEPLWPAAYMRAGQSVVVSSFTVRRRLAPSVARSSGRQPTCVAPQCSVAAREGCEFLVRPALSRTELAACAWLRSHCFCKFPRRCSPDIQQRQRRLRAEEETEILEQKLAGLLPGFPRTACLVATTPVPSDAILPSEELPLFLQGASAADLAVATLDLNLGLRLPGEDLVGDWPKASSSSGDDLLQRRAYISNVCVASAWRSRGLAGELLETAEQMARSWGVFHLYIHVELENTVARRVYEREGYSLEKQETAAAARFLCRKPRMLLHKSLVGTFHDD